jgi:hypothetical protein
MAPEMDSNGICEYFRYRGEVLLEFDVDDVGRTTIWLNDFISYYTCFFLCVVSWSWIIWIHIIHQPVEFSILKKITDGRIGALDPGRGFLHHLDLTGCCLTTAGMEALAEALKASVEALVVPTCWRLDGQTKKRSLRSSIKFCSYLKFICLTITFWIAAMLLQHWIQSQKRFNNNWDQLSLKSDLITKPCFEKQHSLSPQE